MGITTLPIQLANPAAPDRTVEVEMVVDSGAVFSVVPAEVLRKLGVTRHTRERFMLADGRSVTREIGDVLYRFDDRTGAGPVIFGRRGDAALLGVVTLEILRLQLDPLRRRLRPLKLMIA